MGCVDVFNAPRGKRDVDIERFLEQRQQEVGRPSWYSFALSLVRLLQRLINHMNDALGMGSARRRGEPPWGS